MWAFSFIQEKKRCRRWEFCPSGCLSWLNDPWSIPKNAWPHYLAVNLPALPSLCQHILWVFPVERIGGFFQWWLDPKSPKRCQRQTQSPTWVWFFFWVFFSKCWQQNPFICWESSTWAPIKQQTHDPGNQSAPNAAPWSQGLSSVPRTAAAPGESQKRWSSTQTSPINSKINTDTTPGKDLHLWEGGSQKVAHSMRNNIQNLNPAQLLPPEDGLDLPTSSFYHENVAQKKHIK